MVNRLLDENHQKRLPGYSSVSFLENASNWVYMGSISNSSTNQILFCVEVKQWLRNATSPRLGIFEL